MKYLVCANFILLMYTKALAQKPPIDTNAVRTWPSISNFMAISGNGKFMAYTIVNEPVGKMTVVIKATQSDWELKVQEVGSGIFSSNSEWFIYQKNASVIKVKLATDSLSVINGVSDFVPSSPSNANWIACYKLNQSTDVVLYNLSDRRELLINNVKDFSFDANQRFMCVKTLYSTGEGEGTAIWLVDLISLEKKLIWRRRNLNASFLTFSNSSHEVAFLAEETALTQSSGSEKFNKVSSMTLWHYNLGMDSAISIDINSLVLDSGLSISGPLLFAKNNKHLFFNVFKSERLNPDPEAVKLNVWSYRDEILQPEQIRQKSLGPNLLTAFFNIENGRVGQVQMPGEECKTFPNQITGDYTIVSTKFVEKWWKFEPQPSIYIISLADGSRKILQRENNNCINFCFSPDGSYVIYYDIKKSAYYSYNINSGHIENISRSARTTFMNEYSSNVFHSSVAPPAGWLKDSNAVLIYDNYDIWLLYLDSRKYPICITNGYGKKYKIKLRLVDGIESDNKRELFNIGESILITAFSTTNKKNGFFTKRLGAPGDPTELTLNNCLFYRTNSQLPDYNHSFTNGMQPLKADNVNCWIVQKQTASLAPNLYYTTDFKSFKQLSSLNPQEKYIWLKAELFQWKQLDGSFSQGILYKPENFDAKNRYPIIFNYYEKLSHRLYEFPMPEFTGENINIPWFVSNGYLVFTPDIHYKPAVTSNKTTGEWAYNSVVSAAKELSKLPFVNSKGMGIQGHSFGGFETNYLVTHTSIFAAAAEAAGVSDPISTYLTLIPTFTSKIEHFSRQEKLETGHELYACTPWERPDLYRRNSPVLSADRVSTPLLIMHNMNDNNIQWRQAVEMYMALRRLGKRVWMLEYDNGNHTVLGKDALDYTIRLTQFFDHYLKGKSAPIWMTKGIPAKYKGIETGLQLETTSKTRTDFTTK